ncbi:hypothetical protein ILYODFUR_030987 [Ilyodon furcidens]|uniref:Uncharacterized protein n=1 Tax=Ilyodon furcidens TaxID=33524 RepID=A0ABV0TZ66_9TELE
MSPCDSKVAVDVFLHFLELIFSTILHWLFFIGFVSLFLHLLSFFPNVMKSAAFRLCGEGKDQHFFLSNVNFYLFITSESPCLFFFPVSFSQPFVFFCSLLSAIVLPCLSGAYFSLSIHISVSSSVVFRYLPAAERNSQQINVNVLLPYVHLFYLLCSVWSRTVVLTETTF